MTINTLDRRHLLRLALAALAWPAAVSAAPVRYRLDAAASTVGFHFRLAGIDQKGTMTVRQAQVMIDPDKLTNSRVDVAVDAAAARTALPFAAEAMKGPLILDTGAHPTIRFVSTSVRLGAGGRISGGATLTGDLTIRDVTRPVTLEASLFRAAGSAPDDLTRLTIRLQGQISRAAFGATGYPDLVDDTVVLDITAVIEAVD